MKRFFFALFHLCGLTALARWSNRRRVTFLCYHGVTARGERRPGDPHGLHVRADRFEAQLTYLKRYRQVISLPEFVTACEKGQRLPDRAVVITFDDGFRNFLTAAWPLLDRYQMAATLFLITDRIEPALISPRKLSWAPSDDIDFLSWDEVGKLSADRNITIGSHTCSHPHLTEISPSACEIELADSLAAIREKTGQINQPLAYPWGDHSVGVATTAARLGYSCAVTTSGAPNDLDHDLFDLGRVLIGDDDDEPAFAVRVSGLRHWLDRARSFLTRTPTRPAVMPAPPGLEDAS